MPRPLRIQIPGAIYHVMNRGDGHRPIFEDAGDARGFLSLMEEIAAEFDWRFRAYCLMATHYHFLLETRQPNLSAGMQALAGRYTQDFNRRHGRDGRVFRGRFHAILLEPETFLAPFARYTVLNPVLAGRVADPAAWRWSSYRAMAGTAPAPAFLDVSWMIGPYGATLTDAQEAWRADIAECMGDRANVQAIERLLMNRSILGRPDFVRRVRRAVRAQPLRAGRKRARKKGSDPFSATNAV